MNTASGSTSSLYTDVTNRIIVQLEAGCLPWVQPWDNSRCALGMPCNAGTGRRYSGINVLILWDRQFAQGYGQPRWLTYAQARSLGGHVRKGEQGTTVCYADRFTPRGDSDAGGGEGQGEAQRQIAFLKRFTVFNIDQCEDLPEEVLGGEEEPSDKDQDDILASVRDLISLSLADVRTGGDQAFYSHAHDIIQVPPRAAYYEPINWYRTVLHELGHWTGHRSRLDRLRGDAFGSPGYAREELCAEMASAFLCAELGIVPTVRHADYIGSWLGVLREDSKAIFRAASQASKAADYLLSFRSGEARA